MASKLSPILVIETDGSVVDDTYTCTRPFHVYDVHGLVTNQVASNTTVQRQTGGTGAFNALSSALTDNAAAGTLARTTSLATAEDAFAVGDVLRGGSSGLGRQALFIAIVVDPITGA